MAKYFTVHSAGKHHEGAILNLKSVANNLPATTEAEFREAAEFPFPRRGDFGLVASLAGTPLRAATYGHRYWSGEPHWHQPPRWEILLPAPVAIGARFE